MTPLNRCDRRLATRRISSYQSWPCGSRGSQTQSPCGPRIAGVSGVGARPLRDLGRFWCISGQPHRGGILQRRTHWLV